MKTSEEMTRRRSDELQGLALSQHESHQKATELMAKAKHRIDRASAILELQGKIFYTLGLYFQDSQFSTRMEGHASYKTLIAIAQLDGLTLCINGDHLAVSYSTQQGDTRYKSIHSLSDLGKWLQDGGPDARKSDDDFDDSDPFADE